MGMTSTSGPHSNAGGPGPSSSGGSKLMSPISDLTGSNAAYYGGSGSKYDSPLEKPWDLPMPTRTAPQPPTPGGGMTPGGLSVQGSWERDGGVGQVSPGGASTRGNKSASNSPNPNRFSQSFEKAGQQGDYPTGSMSARGSASGPSGAPPRPSRAGTMPLLDAHTGLTAINTAVGPGGPHGITSPSASTGPPTSSHSPYLSSPHIMNSSNSIPSPMPPVPPNYSRAPASTSVLNNGNGNGPHTPMTPMPLQPPPLHHQPFSAPGNPYAMVGLDGEVEKAGAGAEDKDGNEKSKGRERSGTKSSTKEGKKGVFGFMTGRSRRPYRLVRFVALLTLSTRLLDLLNTKQAVVISAPYDPVHLTHVGFNSDTGECEPISGRNVEPCMS